MPTIIKTTVTIVDTQYEFTEKDILDALIRVGKLPSSSAVRCAYMRVPGGGDWSNTDLGLKEHPLIVVTKETTRS